MTKLGFRGCSKSSNNLRTTSSSYFFLVFFLCISKASFREQKRNWWSFCTHKLSSFSTSHTSTGPCLNAAILWQSHSASGRSRFVEHTTLYTGRTPAGKAMRATKPTNGRGWWYVEINNRSSITVWRSILSYVDDPFELWTASPLSNCDDDLAICWIVGPVIGWTWVAKN